MQRITLGVLNLKQVADIAKQCHPPLVSLQFRKNAPGLGTFLLLQQVNHFLNRIFHNETVKVTLRVWLIRWIRSMAWLSAASFKLV